MAALKQAGTPTSFFTSGAAGTANVFPSSTGNATWLGNNFIDPDNANLLYGSNLNGYFIVNAGPAGMNVSMYLVDCGQATVLAAMQACWVAPATAGNASCWSSGAATGGTQSAGAGCKAFNTNRPVWSVLIPPKSVTAAASGRRKAAEASLAPAERLWAEAPSQRRKAAAAANYASFFAPTYYSEFFSQNLWSAQSGISVGVLAASAGRPVVTAATPLTGWRAPTAHRHRCPPPCAGGKAAPPAALTDLRTGRWAPDQASTLPPAAVPTSDAVKHVPILLSAAALALVAALS